MNYTHTELKHIDGLSVLNSLLAECRGLEEQGKVIERLVYTSNLRDEEDESNPYTAQGLLKVRDMFLEDVKYSKGMTVTNASIIAIFREPPFLPSYGREVVHWERPIPFDRMNEGIVSYSCGRQRPTKNIFERIARIN